MPRPLSPHPTPPVGLAALRSAAPPALHSAAPAALHSAAAAALHSAALAALGSAAPAALHSAAAADLLFAAAAALRSAAPAAFRSAAAAALPSAAVAAALRSAAAAALRSAAAAALPSAAVAVCAYDALPKLPSQPPMPHRRSLVSPCERRVAESTTMSGATAVLINAVEQRFPGVLEVASSADQTSGQFTLHEGFQQHVQKTSQQPPQEAPHLSQLLTESTRKEFVTMPLETHMNGDGTPAQLPGASDQFSPTSKLKKRRTSLHHGLRPGDGVNGETVEVLEAQIDHGKLSALKDDDNVNSEAFGNAMMSLEAVHLSLLIMTSHGMPKQVFQEEVIEKIIECIRFHMSRNIFCACDAVYRQAHADDDETATGADGAAEPSKSERKGRRKSKGIDGRASKAVSALMDKVCSILPIFATLLSVTRLPDSSVLQITKTGLEALSVDNVHLLQLKSILLITAIFRVYPHHRSLVMDEIALLLWKLHTGKKLSRTYHLMENSSTIQLVSALLLQLFQCCVFLPEPEPEPQVEEEISINEIKAAPVKKGKRGRRRPSSSADEKEALDVAATNQINDLANTNGEGNGKLDADDGKGSPEKGHSDTGLESAIDAVRYFWKVALERWSAPKAGSEGADSKAVLEALVEDLLLALHLPEYPAASLMLQVLCVFLDSSCGLKSDSSAVKGMAIDILGVIASKLKMDQKSIEKDMVPLVKGLCKPLGDDSSAPSSVDPKEEQVNGTDTAVPGNVKEEPSCTPNGTAVVPTGCVVCTVAGDSARRPNALTSCSACSSVFHSDCMGVSEGDGGPASLGSEVMCVPCLVKQRLERAIGGDTKETGAAVTNLMVLEQMVLDYLAASMKRNRVCADAGSFWIATWLKDSTPQLNAAPESPMNRIYSARFHIFKPHMESVDALQMVDPSVPLLPATAALAPGSNVAVAPRELVLRVVRSLNLRRAFHRSFSAVLTRLLACLKDRPTNRAKAMKALSMVVEVDPSILALDKVRKAVEDRFLDVSVSVREAAIDLVGKHIIGYPEVALKYYNTVTDRIRDTGVSVRKRVIRIVRELCLQHRGFPHAAEALARIFTRFSDEEASVRDLVLKTFHDVWFEGAASTTAVANTDDSAAVGAGIWGTSKVSQEESEEHKVAAIAGQLVEVLRTQKCHQTIVSIIRRSLEISDEAADKKCDAQNGVLATSTISATSFAPLSAQAGGQQRPFVRMRCEAICRYLLDQVLLVQERESDEFAALPFVMALQAFCEVDATLCTPPVDPSRFATTLLPYLTTTQDDRSNGDVKPRERAERQARLACLSESIVRVIAGILAHLRRPPSSLVNELDQVLACLIISSSFMNLVHVSIRCLCTLQIVSPRPLKSFQLLVPRFYRALTNPNESKFHWRSLFALGLLCRYGANEVEALEPPLPIPSILSVFKSFLSSPEEELQQRALQALGFAFIARPQEMVTEDAAHIFGNALRMEAPSKQKVQVLRSFQEYLTDVEEKMVEQNRRKLQTEAAAKKAQDAARHRNTVELQEESSEGIGAGGSSSAAGVVPVAAGAGDTNVCSGVIQQHWEAILQCCMDMDPDVRQTALKLVEIVLNQGLVLPVTCVPQLIALQVDPDETTWKTSHHLLSLINDRWGNYRFIENRFTDGMRLAYGFMRALSAHPTNTQSNPAMKTPTKADSNASRTASGPATHAANAKLLGLAREGLGRVYKLIRGNRSSRNNIFLSIIRKFDSVDASSSMSNKLGSSTPTSSPSTSRAHQEPPSPYSVTPAGAFDIYFLAFCAQVVATFPFALPDEPLFLVHHISRVAHMRGGSLHSSIKYLFRPSSPLGPSVTSAVKAIEEEQAARCGNAYRITEEEEDDEEAGGSQPIEITIPEGASCCGNDPQEQQAFLDGALRRLKDDTRAAMALSLLLQLKGWLKAAYSLTDARCLAYNPSESQRNTNSEALGQRAPGDLSLHNLPLDISNDMRQFILQYQAFKRLMKNESIGDYTGFTVSTPSKPRGGTKAAGGFAGPTEGEEGAIGGEAGDAPYSAPVHGAKRKRGHPPKPVPATPHGGSGDEWDASTQKSKRGRKSHAMKARRLSL
ncbi:unnamed protein product [Closterium sp. Yama58-4]|nr:unnamed protein product [Closterium sp. Yama58-4]